MLCLSGFELYSRRVPLIPVNQIFIIPLSRVKLQFFELSYTSLYIVAFGQDPW